MECRKPDISDLLLRLLGSSLALPLSIIYQTSLVRRVYPRSGKIAIILPIYKGKDAETLRSTFGSRESNEWPGQCLCLGPASYHELL